MTKAPKDIEELEKRIETAAHHQTPKHGQKFTVSASARHGLNIVLEFVSAVFVGAALGYLIDMFLNTKPYLLISLLFLGAAAGFLNVYRYVKKQEHKHG